MNDPARAKSPHSTMIHPRVERTARGLAAEVVRHIRRAGQAELHASEPYTLRSWMKIFSANVQAHRPRTLVDLKSVLRAGDYCCVGMSHSYNGIQVVRDANAILFGQSALDEIEYDPSTHHVTVGPSVTILKLKERLLGHRRRLINSGNYMAQTVIGALATGTHGYGARSVMAECIVRLTFLDEEGTEVTMDRTHPDFSFAALSFGVIGPIVSVTLETAELARYHSDLRICRLSERAGLSANADAITFAALPYSSADGDPTILLHTLNAEAKSFARIEASIAAPLFSWRRVAGFLIRRYWFFDRVLPGFRRKLQRFIGRLNVRYHKHVVTEPTDLDYLYDPMPLLETQRPPNLIKGFFSPTFTAYNLGFFVPADEIDEVIRFVIHQAEETRELGFYLKSLIGVRILSGKSDLVFAGNFDGPAAAIDLFADVRDYAWLERIQREVLAYFPRARPHWAKSAIMDGFRTALGEANLARLRDIHQRHYPKGRLQMHDSVRRLLGLYALAPGTNASRSATSARTMR